MKNRATIAFIILGTAVCLSLWLIAHQASEMRSGDRAALRAACEERNDRDSAVVRALRIVALDAVGDRSEAERIIEPVVAALGPRDCASLYP